MPVEPSFKVAHPNSTSWYSALAPRNSKKWTLLDNEELDKLGVSYLWGGSIPTNTAHLVEASVKVQGDDEFVIAFAPDGYIVWRFKKTLFQAWS